MTWAQLKAISTAVEPPRVTLPEVLAFTWVGEQAVRAMEFDTSIAYACKAVYCLGVLMEDMEFTRHVLNKSTIEMTVYLNDYADDLSQATADTMLLSCIVTGNFDQVDSSGMPLRVAHELCRVVRKFTQVFEFERILHTGDWFPQAVV